MIVRRLLTRPLILLAVAVTPAHTPHHAAAGGTDGRTTTRVTADGTDRGAQRGTTRGATHGATLLLRRGRGCCGRLPGIETGLFRAKAPALNLVQVLLVLALALGGIDEQVLGAHERYVRREPNNAQRNQRYPTVHGFPRLGVVRSASVHVIGFAYPFLAILRRHLAVRPISFNHARTLAS